MVKCKSGMAQVFFFFFGLETSGLIFPESFPCEYFLSVLTAAALQTFLIPMLERTMHLLRKLRGMTG